MRLCLIASSSPARANSRWTAITDGNFRPSGAVSNSASTEGSQPMSYKRSNAYSRFILFLLPPRYYVAATRVRETARGILDRQSYRANIRFSSKITQLGQFVSTVFGCLLGICPLLRHSEVLVIGSGDPRDIRVYS